VVNVVDMSLASDVLLHLLVDHRLDNLLRHRCELLSVMVDVEEHVKRAYLARS
jgi:hypothetical protein